MIKSGKELEKIVKKIEEYRALRLRLKALLKEINSYKLGRVRDLYIHLYKLYKNFGSSWFNLEQAYKVLGLKPKSTTVILNRLRRRGYLEIRKDEKDIRNSWYKVKFPGIFEKLRSWMLKK